MKKAIKKYLKMVLDKMEDKPTQPPERKEKLKNYDNDYYSEQSKYDEMIASNFRRTASMDCVSSELVSAMDSNDMSNCVNNLSNDGRVPTSLKMWYGKQSFIGFQMCAIIAQHWLVLKCCSVPARDAIRKGYEITCNDGKKISTEILDSIAQADIDFNINKVMCEFITKGKIFGIRIAMFKVESDDPDYYYNPFNIDGVKPGSYKGIVQIDPYWITPELDAGSVSDPTSLNFYEPEWWRVSGERIHRTHLVIFRNGELSDTLKPTYMYGGIPLPQQIYERVYCAERTANEAPQLAMSKRTKVFKTDTAKFVENELGATQVMQKMQVYEDNYNKTVINLDTEDVVQFDTSLADFSEAISTQYELVSSVACVPITKLLGMSPKGFSATGDYDESNYHEELESIQENNLSPLLNRHHQILIKSEISPENTFKTRVQWRPLDTRTAEEQALLNKTKSENDQMNIMNGIISPSEARKRLIVDQDSGYNGLDEDLDEDTEEMNEEEEIKKPNRWY